MSDKSREELEAKLKKYVGIETGPAQVASDAVNEAMIRHWCDAMGDRNPVYTDADAAKQSPHGAMVAPPAMLLSWVNTAFYQELMAAMRIAIAEGRFVSWSEETLARLDGEG